MLLTPKQQLHSVATANEEAAAEKIRQLESEIEDLYEKLFYGKGNLALTLFAAKKTLPTTKPN